MRIIAAILFLILGYVANGAAPRVSTDTLYAEAIGDKFTVQFKRSDSFDHSKPFTLIYIADASLGLGQYAMGTNRKKGLALPANSVLVGIGHVNSSNEKRARDFIASDISGKTEKDFANADLFYAFLKSEIVPFVEKKFPGAAKKVFIGHSFSGLFSLYASLQNEQLFDEYFAISPSVWANHHELMKIEEAYSGEKTDLDARIHIYAGGLEILNKVLYSSRKFYETISARNFQQLRINFEVIRLANHFSIRKPALERIINSLTIQR